MLSLPRWTVGLTLWLPVLALAEPDPALFLPPPSDAVVLFDGTSAEAFCTPAGAPATWTITDGALTAAAGAGDLVSRKSFGSGQWHLEFRATGTGLPALQLLGCTFRLRGEGELSLDATAALRAEAWHAVDLMVHAPTLAGDEPARPGRWSAVVDGAWVATGRAFSEADKPAVESPLRLLEAGAAVAFRNLWFRPLESRRSEHPPVRLAPLPDASVLLGADGPVGLTSGGDRPFQWTVEGAEIEVREGGGSVYSKDRFQDFQLHLEFRPPAKSHGSGQADGNSGLYLHNLYELQILNSYEDKEPQKNGCGSLYRVAAPLTNACQPRGEWQSYDVLFRAAVVDDGGKVLRNARLSVRQNGIWIHDDLEVPGPTGSAARRPQVSVAPFQLQNHGNPVRFRNIWIRPLTPAE